MKRIVLSLITAFAALFVIITPAAVFAEDEPSLDLATTNTTQCPCTPNVEMLVYFDQNGDGKYDPGEGEETRDQWRLFLYQACVGWTCANGPWTLFDSTLTGGSDGVYDSGTDTGKAYFKGLPLNRYYYVCAEFPRSWLFLTEPIQENLSPNGPPKGNLTGGWNTGPLVSVVENPQPLAWDDPENGARNWDESALCYKVKLRNSCNSVQLRFGVLTYDQTLQHPASN